MPAAMTKGLMDAMEQKLKELAAVAADISEKDAARRPPEEEWCVKEVLSHLCADEREDIVTLMRHLLEGDVPLTEIGSGLAYYTPQRQAMTAPELLSECRRRYQEAADALALMGDEEMALTVHVPLLRESPLGERPTVEQLVGALLQIHLPEHIDQIRRIRGKLG